MEYVQTGARLRALVKAIAGTPILALDTEAAGYHRYHDRICLVQLSTRERTFVIDALAFPDLAALRATFGDSATEIVLHDAEYDLRLLARDHVLSVARLFDTKIAAQFLGEPQIGLAGLADKYLGVRLDKKHQRADWARRPLAVEMLEYAAEDTRHLPALRDRLREELERRDRLAWAEEEFALCAQVRWPEPAAENDGYLRLKNARDLKPRQLAALRELHAWREAEASERDVAPFRVVSNELLVAVARAMPETAAALSRVAGVSGAVLSRRGDALLSAVGRARALEPDQLPERPRGPRRPPPDVEFERRVDRLKAVRDRVADALGLDRGFLMPRQQLEDVARQAPASTDALRAIAEMRDWQVAAVGDALLAALGP